MNEEEAWAKRPDPAAVEFLLGKYSYLVANSVSKVANTDRAPGERDDCLQEGRLALLRAIQRFDPTRENDFSSYAIPLVRGAAEEWLRQKATFVKRPGQDAAKRLSKVRAALSAAGIDDPTEEQLAAALELDPSALEEFLDRANIPTLIELDAPTGEEESLADHIAGPDDFAAEETRRTRLTVEKAIHRLRPALHRHVFGSVAEDGLTPRQAAKLYGISPLVADGIHRKSLARVRRLLKQDTAESCAEKPPDIKAKVEAQFHLDPVSRKTLASWAGKRGVSQGEAVRWLVEEYLRQQESGAGDLAASR